MEDTKHFVLVDFENVHDIDLATLNGHPAEVALLIGKKQPSLPAKLVEQLCQISCEVRLIKVGVIRKNALDLVLAFHLGKIVAANPRAQLHIISKDKTDFDPLVTHLKTNHVSVTRHDSLATLPFVESAAKPLVLAVKKAAADKPKPTRKTAAPFVAPKPSAAPAVEKTTPATAKPLVSRHQKIAARLKNPANRSRPTTRKALIAKIRNDLGKENSEAAVTKELNDLIDQKVLTIDSQNKVTYLNSLQEV